MPRTAISSFRPSLCAALLVALGLAAFVGLAGCAADRAAPAIADAGASIVLATTTSTEDSGLLDALLPAFESDTGIRVKVVAVGTGQAIRLGEDGNADVLLVHARDAEDKFVADGYGDFAHDVMYNRFLVVGPASDPAGARNAASAADAFRAIAAAEAPFVSRGDDSGTHKKELSIWKEAGIAPEGDWYVSAGQGMGATLQMADETGAYTLTDEATYLAQPGELTALRDGDEALLNPYGAIRVVSTKRPDEAKAFISFLVGEEGQRLIGEFGKDRHGKPLFVPNGSQR